MQLTPNFNLNEFRSRDGAEFPADVRTNIEALANALQIIRNEFNEPISITSGYRSPAHNRAVGGAVNSTHIRGLGADFRVRNHTPQQVAAKIEELIAAGKIPQGGLKAYNNWVHYDIRGVRARW